MHSHWIISNLPILIDGILICSELQYSTLDIINPVIKVFVRIYIYW